MAADDNKPEPPELNPLVSLAKVITQPLMPLLEQLVGKGKIRDEDRPIIALAVLLVLVLIIVLFAQPNNPFIYGVLFLLFILVVAVAWARISPRPQGGVRTGPSPVDAIPTQATPGSPRAQSGTNMGIAAEGPDTEITDPKQQVLGSPSEDVSMQINAKGGAKIVKPEQTHSSRPGDDET